MQLEKGGYGPSFSVKSRSQVISSTFLLITFYLLVLLTLLLYYNCITFYHLFSNQKHFIALLSTDKLAFYFTRKVGLGPVCFTMSSSHSLFSMALGFTLWELFLLTFSYLVISEVYFIEHVTLEVHIALLTCFIILGATVHFKSQTIIVFSTGSSFWLCNCLKNLGRFSFISFQSVPCTNSYICL
jgi:hypothetical protein